MSALDYPIIVVLVPVSPQFFLSRFVFNLNVESNAGWTYEYLLHHDLDNACAVIYWEQQLRYQVPE